MNTPDEIADNLGEVHGPNRLAYEAAIQLAIASDGLADYEYAKMCVDAARTMMIRGWHKVDPPAPEKPDR